MADLTDDGIKSYITTSQKEFAEVAKVFGDKENPDDSASGKPAGSEDNTDSTEFDKAEKEFG